MHVFYTPDILERAELPEEEAAHAVRVLRLQPGDEIMLTDGNGNFYRAEISTANHKRCLVNILETLPQPPLWNGHLHIAMAPTKNMDRTEWFVEKATEIGLDELTFLNCRFSERKVIKTERIAKILVSAIKQSLKARLPKLNEMTDFDKFIARPFEGEYPFKRTPRRHDYSLLPPKNTMLDLLSKAGFATISVGKIYDIFAGKSVSQSNRTTSNADGMQKTMQMLDNDFEGLCFTNLVDFDMVYGHRNDIDGYAKAMTEFDTWLGEFLPKLGENDLLLITADHGCDPKTPSTDHSREYVPMLLYGKNVKPVNLSTRKTFSDISATVLEYFGVDKEDTQGTSFLKEVLK